MPDEIIRQTYSLNDKSNWKLKDARESVIKDEDWGQSITKILYRPFDEKWIFYHDTVIERSRKEVMQHIMQENLGLITSRIIKGGEYHHAFASKNATDAALLAANTASSSYLFPLYLYQQKANPKKRSLSSVMMLFEPEAEYGEKKPNLSPEFIDKLTREFKKAPSPEEIFCYIYAVLYSNIYRTKYAGFLKIDFPRIPFTNDFKLFLKLAEFGKQLADLHLLKSKELDKMISKFPISGSNKVEKLKYEDEKVWINKDQYFDGIKEEIWQYQIGGYQICEKWLKDRKGRTLSFEEITTYRKIVTAISKTIKLQDKIDKFYTKVEKKL